MKKYEKIVGLKTIWLAFVRRWKTILLITVPAIVITVLISQLFVPKKFQSSASFLNNVSLNTTTHNAAQLQIQKEAASYLALES